MVVDVGNMMGAAQRAQLLALQKTARQLDVASARLASGQKVLSALDNPQNFFAARSLNNRASDVARLLDGIGQNIKAIEEADHGVKAGLKILDLAESYLLDVQKKYMAGEVGTGTGLAPNETAVTFASNADLIQYVAGQDMPASGTVTVPNSTEVTLSGNFWKRKAFNYTVTANTVLEFDYRSTLIQEVSTIGFDSDTNFGNDSDRFWIYGTQTSGITYAAPTTAYDYSGSGAWESISIPVGAFFTGSYTHMTFVNDDDGLPYGNGSFRNIILREGPKQSVSDGAQFEKGYADIINQLDLLVKDAQYLGINLLKGDKMTSYFNPSLTSKLETQGIDATFAGLGLSKTDFNSLDAVQAKLDQVRVARNTLRKFGSTLSTNLNVLQIRQEFMKSDIDIHRSGAHDLTDADLNEEGANMLALQTAQQLEVTMLAMRPANVLSILA